MRIISQQNPLWSKNKLGASSLTIGRFGCTTCGLSMLSDYFGCYKDPVQIQQFQKYTPDGLVLWNTLNLPKMAFEIRRYGANHAAIQASLKHPDKAVLLEVNHSHWVVALGKVPLVDAYFIADPWSGSKTTTYKYKNAISGSAHFVRK